MIVKVILGVVISAMMQIAGAATHALLVGVSGYPGLPERYRLRGPANDVALVRLALRQVGVPVSQIQVLADGVDGSIGLPTRANILDAIAALAHRARRGDWVVVLLAGHGSQQPQSRARRTVGGTYVEPDGLDEVFLPYDVTDWRGELGSMGNIIIDDDLGAAISRLTRAGLNVWLVFDTCHAGDMAKGSRLPGRDRMIRYVPPGLLGVPSPQPQVLADRDIDRREITRRLLSPTGQGDGKLVVFSASQADEPAAEEVLPVPDWANRPLNGRTELRFGMFSYQIALALPAWKGAFADLVRTLDQVYRRRPFPTPVFEGALDEIISLPNGVQIHRDQVRRGRADIDVNPRVSR
jgi:hypothetical protein